MGGRTQAKRPKGAGTDAGFKNVPPELLEAVRRTPDVGFKNLPSDFEAFLRLPPSQQKQLEAKMWVDAFHWRYDKTRSPLYAWAAYQQCRNNGLAVPEWILACFDELSGQLVGLAWDEGKGPGYKRTARLAQKLAELVTGSSRRGRSGVGKAFEELRETWDRFGMARDVYRLHHHEGTKLDFAYDAVAKDRGRSRSAVMRAWYEYEEFVAEQDF